MTNRELKSNIKELNKDELTDLITYIEKLLFVEDNGQVDVCPKCGSIEFVKNGNNKDTQRYLCKCGHSFSHKHKCLSYRSKISKQQWLEFINHEITGMSLNDIAYYMNLSLTTLYRMRQKLYHACEVYLDSIVLKGQTQLDCAYTKINLKGTKPENMPRISKKHGNGTTFSGISHHKVCILIAIDEYDNHFMKIAGLGPESFEKYIKFTKHFKDSSMIISDSKDAIKLFANHLGIENDRIPTIPNGKRYTTDKGNNIQQLNQFCSTIPEMISLHRGMGLKHLNGYLAFQCIKKMFKYKFDRRVMGEEIYNAINTPNQLLCNEIEVKELPVDLKDAYWEFNYGIFAH